MAVEDIFPTVLAACGVSLPTVDDAGSPLILDEKDPGPYLRGVPGTHRPQKLITHAPCGSRSSFFTTYHEGMWKLIYSYTTSSPDTSTNLPLGSFELDDLSTDIHEANNRAAAEPARVINMARGMVAELERLGAPYPVLINHDASLFALGLPANANDKHPVILPAIPGVDADNDGLEDNAEDPNRNGLVDPTETDPDNANTAGDGTNDGAEIRTGTYPLNASSDFRGTLSPAPGGALTLTWPSRPGALYQIQTSDDLRIWPSPPLATVPAAASGTTTSYQLPASAAPQTILPGGADARCMTKMSKTAWTRQGWIFLCPGTNRTFSDPLPGG